jgi:hypothetical protein
MGDVASLFSFWGTLQLLSPCPCLAGVFLEDIAL